MGQIPKQHERTATTPIQMNKPPHQKRPMRQQLKSEIAKLHSSFADVVACRLFHDAAPEWSDFNRPHHELPSAFPNKCICIATNVRAHDPDPDEAAAADADRSASTSSSASVIASEAELRMFALTCRDLASLSSASYFRPSRSHSFRALMQSPSLKGAF